MDSEILNSYSMIKKNYEYVMNKISEHALKVGRKPDEIKIVAVTKTHPVEIIKTAYDVGLRIFGENYAQELRDKSEQLNFPDIEWHYIGRIQTNKLKYIVPVAYLIHSVYRINEIEEINKIASKMGKIQKILIEVNVSGEETKGGISPNNIEDLLKESEKFKNVQVIGLMTMAPFVEPESTRKYFRMLREIRDGISKRFPNLKELSMGMSNDFEVAVEEGSTIVRIGTAIFGERGK
ncbi:MULTISPECIES: YggS family pyridoxal phosphate-dependent enzyme [Fervidobacterium]|uniref:Pyridoxal phosphate homeostasis protein n=1 Tax=Fervidobacterium nodosum (strain ATCC 35602 / DSM 5306 / Rt17-B1) TaxID=381764 RepID=A7HJD7_FERNB|nr:MULTISPECIES: YggS family pyridoxal phosphate-dependent enzyme [Fervidobacterium]ABS60020.1 alanine racemase domain protein [Fervidobacterium nodosum Rt17-B1]HOJ94187.1 YggS family pyridoxal phosphate-dependent enzyme [Fervidobacterium nodosum]